MIVKRAVRAAIAHTGLGPRILRRRSGTVVLMYHSVTESGGETSYPYSISADLFQRQLELLSEVGRFVPASKLFDDSGTPTAGLRFVVTFDDGYKNNFETAAPILESRGIPAVFFVTTGFIDDNAESFMDWRDVRQLSTTAGFTVGAHCCHHLNLLAVNEADAVAEITQSKSIIEDHIDQRVDYFSYPSGGYSSELSEIVADAGYRAAFRDRPNDGTDDYALGRFGVSKYNQLLNNLTAYLTTAPLIHS